MGLVCLMPSAVDYPNIYYCFMSDKEYLTGFSIIFFPDHILCSLSYHRSVLMHSTLLFFCEPSMKVLLTQTKNNLYLIFSIQHCPDLIFIWKLNYGHCTLICLFCESVVWIFNVEGVILKLQIQAFTMLLNLRTVLCGRLPGLGLGLFLWDARVLCVTKSYVNWKMSLLP